MTSYLVISLSERLEAEMTPYSYCGVVVSTQSILLVDGLFRMCYTTFTKS